MKQRQFGRDSFEYVLKNYESMTLAELADDLSMRETTLAHALMIYCLTHEIEMPKLLLERKASDVKVLKRHDANQQIRISVLRLAQANLGEVTRFKSFIDPEKRIVLVTAEDDVAANTIDEALTELFGVHPELKKARKQARKEVVINETELDALPAIIN